MSQSHNRNDLIYIFNNAHFFVSHYFRGHFPGYNRTAMSSPINRLFFPLSNPNGEKNYIEDPFKNYTLCPGKMYFVPAFLPVRFALDKDIYFLSIHVNLDIFHGVELFSGCSHMLEIPCPEEFQYIMEIFDKNQESLFFDALKFGSLTFSIVTKIFDFYTVDEFASALSLKKFSHLSYFLLKEGNAQTSVSELAELCGISRENFTRNFIRTTGITPKKMIDRFVIKRCIMLLNEGCSLKEISFQLKFSNEFAFSRYFKRMTGESPHNWRQKQNKILISNAKKTGE